MASSNKDHSLNLRPYQNPSEFALLYNVSYNPNEGVIDYHTGKPISFSLPTTLQYNNQQNHGGLSKIGIGMKYSSKVSHKLKDIPSSLLLQLGNKDIYSDLELQEYFDFNNLKELFKTLVQSFIRNYFRVVLSEPFEVTRFILQVGAFNTSGVASGGTSKVMDQMSVNGSGNGNYDEDDEDDDEEDVDFFASTSDVSLLSPGKPRIRRKSNIERSVPSIRDSMMLSSNDRKLKKNHIKPISLNTLDIMKALLSKEGSKGIWRGINTSFIYQTLSSTIEAWLTGFLSPFLNIPDPFFIDIIHSSNPFKSLCLSIFAGVLTLIILQPIDLIRLKFIITSTTLKDRRSFRKILLSYSWKDFLVPVNLIIPTLNFSLASSLWKKCTPYLLYTKFNIDKYSSPGLYWTITLFTSISELFVKLPLELLLRRAQLDHLLNEDCNEELKISRDEMSVQFAGYFGYLTTLYYVYIGSVPSYALSEYPIAEDNENKGIEAIFRGWRVGLLNVFSSWGLDLLNETSHSNFKEERF